MVAPQVASPAVQAAVLDYFAGERAEMSIAIGAFLMVAAFAVWLFLSSRTGFALALMMTVIAFGATMGTGLASLLIRDHTSSRVLGHALKTERYAPVIEREQARVERVLSKFRYYRWGAAVLGMLAIAGLTLSGRDWVRGVAAGLLMVVFAQVVIDHFSEARAQLYLAKLTTV